MASWTSCRYFLFLLWMYVILICCIFLFTGGFLLRRQVLEEKSSCGSSSSSKKNHSAAAADMDDTICTPSIQPRFSKAIVIIVDALKYEFTLFDETIKADELEHFQNRLPVMNRLASEGKAKLFEFMADPPTTTMQRLKGLTTGSLPTFVDLSSNFGSYEITEDNIIDQLRESGRKRVVFAGDDTWMGLFPKQFSRAFPFPSFDVWDLDTVDRGVHECLFKELNDSSSWDVIIGHYLGVDHAGHKFGPRHPEMTRKLTEMNEAIEKVVEKMPEDCVLFVMGDHGMTMSGDHGGDSRDEVSAALFAYSKKFDFHKNERKQDEEEELAQVEQVDFVPTFSLLLGVPIPYSNLGKIVEPLILSYPDLQPAAANSESEKQFSSSSSFSVQSRQNGTKARLRYMNSNVEQVMRYLDSYRLQGGKLPFATYTGLAARHATFKESQYRPLSPEDMESIYREGSDLLKDAKTMCQSVWVEFDLHLMGAGLTLFLLQTALGFLLLATPKNRLLTGIITTNFILYLWLTLLAGISLGCLILLSSLVNPGDRGGQTIAVFAIILSVMLFGFNLLWKLRNSISEIVSNSVRCGLRFKSLILALSVSGCFFGLFSNSFVVEEATLLNFFVMTHMFLFLTQLRTESSYGGKTTSGFVFVSVLVIAGLVRLSNVYFRCREEQSAYCMATDFHKPIGTLPKDPVLKTYKNWRFFSTILSVALTVILPRIWLKRGGNLNGSSVAVTLSSIFPIFIGTFMVFYWAMQGHELSSTIAAWQQNLLAQAAFVFALTVLGFILIQPKLLFLEEKSREVPKYSEGVQSYFAFIRSQWRNHFTMSESRGRGSRKLVFGLGCALSAPLLVIFVMILFITMLILGDGLAPSAFIAFTVMAVFAGMSSVERFSEMKTVQDLFAVPWSTVFGWWLLEQLFFFSSGHQPTFPTLQWSAAFVGFSGTNYGAGKDSSALNFVIPAVLVGWNTYASRILFGLALPFLLLAPFTLWLRIPGLRRNSPEEETTAAANKSGTDPDKFEGDGGSSRLPPPADITDGANNNPYSELEQGEVVLLERPEEAKTQLFNLCSKYILLQAFRLFGTMFSAAVLRRHLMVWKIFAPRFIFEAVGFSMSAMSIIATYLVTVRVHNVLLHYYRGLQKQK